jgi:hypothetical protein
MKYEILRSLLNAEAEIVQAEEQLFHGIGSTFSSANDVHHIIREKFDPVREQITDLRRQMEDKL